MSKSLTPREIAIRRAIQRFELVNGKGVIVANGKLFRIQYDDLLDLVQAVEMIMLKLTGKVLQAKFKPQVTDRKALKFDALSGGDYTLYDGTQGEAPVPAFNPCEIADQILKTHYLAVYINGNRWDSWFCRLDELVKCLYLIVREAQEDAKLPKAPRSVLMMNAPRPTSTIVRTAGHA
jgi:hypothetical protein